MSGPLVKVGVACFVFKDGKFLMGQRKGSHGEGTWSIPGGHQEYGESFEETAAREVKEETGLIVKNIRFGALTNDYFPKEGKHYVSVWMISDFNGGQEKIIEPDRYFDQKWYSFDALPDNLFLPWQQLLKSQFLENLKTELFKSLNS